MAFKVESAATQAPSGTMKSDRRLCVTADGLTLVEAGDVRAASLLCPEGGEIHHRDVEHLGLELVDGKVVQRGQDDSESKEAAKSEDKAKAPPENKSKK